MTQLQTGIAGRGSEEKSKFDCGKMMCHIGAKQCQHYNCH
jgi:hypothetical protein